MLLRGKWSMILPAMNERELFSSLQGGLGRGSQTLMPAAPPYSHRARVRWGFEGPRGSGWRAATPRQGVHCVSCAVCSTCSQEPTSTAKAL